MCMYNVEKCILLKNGWIKHNWIHSTWHNYDLRYVELNINFGYIDFDTFIETNNIFLKTDKSKFCFFLNIFEKLREDLLLLDGDSWSVFF